MHRHIFSSKRYKSFSGSVSQYMGFVRHLRSNKNCAKNSKYWDTAEKMCSRKNIAFQKIYGSHD